MRGFEVYNACFHSFNLWANTIEVTCDIILEAVDNYLTGNLTGRGETLNFRGSAETSEKARLTLNARVEMSPESLE